MKKSTNILASTIISGALALQGSTSNAQGTSVSDSKSSESIRPFRVHIPMEDLKDLKMRILNTRWPEKETVADQSQGAQLATMKELLKYWGNDYDWRKGEAKLNAYPQFLTRIDGLDIHFIHVKSRHKNAMPI